MKILALDSSGLVASAAIVENDCLLAEYNVQYKKTHSQTLLPMLEELKRMVDLDLTTIDAIAVAAGPGSFTGLRIGSATAKGLGFALDIPIIEVPTLDGLAYNLYGTDKLVCPMMDARRNQVYTGIYQFQYEESISRKKSLPGKYRLEILKEQYAASLDDFIQTVNTYNKEVIFLGDAVPVYAEQISQLIEVPFSFAPAHMNRQRSAALAVLGADYYEDKKIVSADDHVPSYLRLSQAEREKADKMKEQK